MLINIVLITIGMLLLIKGGDFLVDGASSLARRFNVSELAIGLTIVGFGTSAPEFAISLLANINNHPEVALGNVIGSINFNLLFILGITAVLMPIAVQKKTVYLEIPFSFLSIIVLFLLANFSIFSDGKNMLSRIDGLIFLILFGLFIFYVFKSMKNEETNDVKTPSKYYTLFKSIIFIILGLVFLVGGGRIVVYSAVNIAYQLNISEKIISLTIIAVGTSLPELVTSIIAILKKKSDLAIGNIIGSNIFNILLILGVSSLVKPMEYLIVFNTDIYLYIFSVILLFIAMFTGKKKTLDRWEGAIFVLLYIGYVVFMIIRK